MSNGSVIVTGGAGFVGKHLITELLRHKSFLRIVVFDTAVAGLPKGVEGYEVDITDDTTYVEILREVRPQWIVHLAAVSSVGFSFAHKDLTRTVNVVATETLLQRAIAEDSSVKFLVVSSADIYGIVDPISLPELPLSMARPTNPYGQSKLEMEQMIEKKYNEYCIRVRPFPHIGPGQGTGFVTADFASQIAAIERGEAQPEILVGNLEAKRDFTDVRDVVRAYHLLLSSGTLGEVYHVASGRAHSVQSVLDTLLAMSDVDIRIKQDPDRMRPSDNPVLIGAIDKIRDATNWKPEIPLEESLTDILHDWRNRV